MVGLRCARHHPTFHQERNPHLAGVGRQILKHVVFRPREIAETVGDHELVTGWIEPEQIAGRPETALGIVEVVVQQCLLIGLING